MRSFASGCVVGLLVATTYFVLFSSNGTETALEFEDQMFKEASTRLELLMTQLQDLQESHALLLKAQGGSSDATRGAVNGGAEKAFTVPKITAISAEPGETHFAPSQTQLEHKAGKVGATFEVESSKSFETLGVYELAHLATKNPSDARVQQPLADCNAIRNANNINPLKSWGTADAAAQAQWHAKRCDILLKGDVFLAEGSVETAWFANFPKQLADRIAARQPHERRQRTTDKIVTGVGLGSVSRGIANPGFETIPLFVHSIPSLVATASPDYELWLYVAYDAGDAFYDRETTQTQIANWLSANFVKPLADKGVTAQFALLRFENDLRKPGPAFNYVMRALFEDGADYLVRVNDDSEFRSAGGRGWQQAMVETLSARTPSNFGVGGPGSENDNQSIYTHDMVHRTHLIVFDGIYYPLTLSDWWMDNWITEVYGGPEDGPYASRIADARIYHHVGEKRYVVNDLHSHLLREEVALGKAAVQRYLDTHRT